MGPAHSGRSSRCASFTLSCAASETVHYMTLSAIKEQLNGLTVGAVGVPVSASIN